MKGFRVLCVPELHSVEIGLARQQTLADQLTSQSAPPFLLVWRCQSALLVTPSEMRLPHFDRAAAAMQAAGWPVLRRKSGGGACPVGPGTVQVSTIEAVSPPATMNAKYAALTRLIQSALGFFHIPSRTGAVAGAYCSGSYDLAVKGKKIAGMSQHWFRNRCGIRCVITASSINVEEPPDVLAGVANGFYDSAGGPFRCQEAALTSMRLCEEAAGFAGSDLASAVMMKLTSSAAMLGGAGGQDVQHTPYPPLPLCSPQHD